jgi:magnesium-transporting ATPase (P-type)
MNRGATANHESAPPPAAPETARPWHQMPVESVLATLKSTPQGLDAHEAQRRLAAVGPEVALTVAARQAGLDQLRLEREYPRVAEIPFDSDRKCMTTIHQDPAGGFLALTKGAVEVILARAMHMATSSGMIHVDPA